MASRKLDWLYGHPIFGKEQASSLFLFLEKAKVFPLFQPNDPKIAFANSSFE